MKKLSYFITILFIGITTISCGQGKSASGNLPGYDLNHPVKYDMPADLLEISGIAFNNGDASTIYAEQDEDGKLFWFKPGDKNISHTKFGKHGDYEDVAILNNYAILMRSDASFYTFPLSGIHTKDASGVQEFKQLLPVGEYEGMHADGGKLYVLCKIGKGVDHNKICNGYVVSLASNGSLSKTGNFSIDVKKIAALAGAKKMKFHPSALAKNPLTRQWYILSSVNKMIVVTDANWNVQQIYPIDPDMFLQPEGMAFDNQGNLYISNEGSKTQPGNILLFKYKR
ncbi:SdiA-regulated family protein [Mucilaginibacter sp. 21P]|uniref:SdiA-regulated domain-containing protein n=1 Tax=Mucilaginibacter sp. 21P TaxID=2778902 RepID=UPI001C57BC10|nr:SdiA-regulated domain-containing protein [Mucilaginibacter sp. 21P]QXV64978.1 SdiA-regulated family protein [Mucilaginibacter sp. 21P]